MQSGRLRSNQLTASSIYNKNGAPTFARLQREKTRVGYGAWVAKHNNHHQWLKADFRRAVRITKICTQGRQDAAQWVTRYTVSYSLDRLHWARYRWSTSADRVSKGNVRVNSSREHPLLANPGHLIHDESRGAGYLAVL